MVTAAVQPSQPPRPTLTPEERANMERTRAMLHAAGMTDDDIEHMADPVSPEEQAAAAAWLRGEGPWPFG